MPHLVQAVRAVDRGRFVERRVNTGYRGEVDDRVVAERLPDLRYYVHEVEILRGLHERNGLAAKSHDEAVDNAFGGDHVHQDGYDDNGGDEVGKVNKSLGDFFVPFHLDLIEQQGEYDRNPEAKENVLKAQTEGVSEYAAKEDGGDEILEVLQADPFDRAVKRKYASAYLIVLERHCQAVHRNVVEHYQKYDRRQQKQQKPFVAPEVLEEAQLFACVTDDAHATL